MKRLFRKYFNSVLYPDEFDRFSAYVSKKGNEEAVYQAMRPEWERLMAGDEAERSNHLLLQKIQRLALERENLVLQKKLRRTYFSLAIAALLVLGMLIPGLWYYNAQSRMQHVPSFTVSVPPGARLNYSLPDGSSVWLNSGSVLTYSGGFSSRRHVDLEGEAFFDIVKSKVPFVVNTGYGQVNVHGTSFNVQAWQGESFAVTLERGEVGITVNGESHETILYPGEQARLEKGSLVKDIVSAGLFTSWKDGKLTFQREFFPVVMKRLERRFNVTVEFSENDFENLWFTGTIKDETLPEVMEMICKAAPVKYSYDSETRTVKITTKIMQ